jgi:hypothetical protein
VAIKEENCGGNKQNNTVAMGRQFSCFFFFSAEFDLFFVAVCFIQQHIFPSTSTSTGMGCLVSISLLNLFRSSVFNFKIKAVLLWQELNLLVFNYALQIYQIVS